MRIGAETRLLRQIARLVASASASGVRANAWCAGSVSSFSRR